MRVPCSISNGVSSRLPLSGLKHAIQNTPQATFREVQRAGLTGTVSNMRIPFFSYFISLLLVVGIRAVLKSKYICISIFILLGKTRPFTILIECLSACQFFDI